MSETDITGFTNIVYSVGFNFDGKIVASAHADGRIRLWNAETGEFIRELFGHRTNVVSVAFSPTEPILASASYDKTIRFWDYNKPLLFIEGIITGAALATIDTTHTQVITCMAFNGETVATGSDDKTVRLYDPLAGSELHVIDIGSRVFSVALSPDGNIIAVGSIIEGTSLYDVKTGTLLHRTPDGDTDFTYVKSVAFSPDGKLVAAGTEHANAYLLDVKTGKFLRFFRGFYYLDKVSGSDVYGYIDVTTGQRIRSFAGTEYMQDVGSVAFSPDGRTLAIGDQYDRIHFWEVNTGIHLGKVAGHSEGKHHYEVSGLAFSPDGRTLASGSYDGTVLLWDYENLGFISMDAQQRPEDVNNDGIINILDLVFVANSFGQIGESPADINKDGIINIMDLVLVAKAFE